MRHIQSERKTPLLGKLIDIKVRERERWWNAGGRRLNTIKGKYKTSEIMKWTRNRKQSENKKSQQGK